MGFTFKLASVAKRAPKSLEPEMMVTVTTNKLRFNEAASTLLNLRSGDFAALLHNAEEAKAAGEPTTWALIKGFPKKDQDGNTIEAEGNHGSVDGLAYYGFKLASTRTEDLGTGIILEGNDAANWKTLGGDVDVHQVYSISTEPEEVEVLGIMVKAYILTFDRQENKTERKRKDSGQE